MSEFVVKTATRLMEVNCRAVLNDPNTKYLKNLSEEFWGKRIDWAINTAEIMEQKLIDKGYKP
jgi:hypothetical protein